MFKRIRSRLFKPKLSREEQIYRFIESVLGRENEYYVQLVNNTFNHDASEREINEFYGRCLALSNLLAYWNNESKQFDLT